MKNKSRFLRISSLLLALVLFVLTHTLESQAKPLLQGSPIGCGMEVIGSITDTSFMNQWSFEGDANQTIQLDMIRQDVETDLAPSLIVMLDRQVLVVQDGNNVTGRAFVALTLPEEGSYTILAGRISGSEGSTSGDYVLTLDCVDHSETTEVTVQEIMRIGRGFIRDLDWSPDYQTVAVASSAGLWIYELGSLDEPIVFSQDFMSSVAFNSEGNLIASGGRGTVYLWDVVSGEQINMLSHPGQVTSVAFSSDGLLVASGGGDSIVRVWNAGTGENLEALEGHTDYVTSVTFSPDGRTVVSGSQDGTVRLWHAESGTELAVLQSELGLGISSVRYSPDGLRLAVTSGNWVTLWDALRGLELGAFNPGRWFSIAFGADGLLVASPEGNATRLWHAETGETLQTIESLSVSLSRSGRRYTTRGPDNVINLWDTQSGTMLGAIRGHGGSVSSVAYSPDGLHLASVSGEIVYIWDANSGEQIAAIREDREETEGVVNTVWSVEDVTFSPDGLLMAAGSADTILLWDVAHSEVVTMLKGHMEGSIPEQILSVAFSPDGSLIASGSRDRVRIWDISTGTEIVTFPEQSNPVWSVAFSPDKTILATGIIASSDNLILWDISSGEILTILEGHTRAVSSVAFSPDGSILASASSDGRVLLWDVDSGEQIAFLRSSGPVGPVSSVVFSPDGKWLASGNFVGLGLWDIETRNLVAEPQRHTDQVVSIAFGPDSNHLVSGSTDGTMRVWEIMQ